MIKLKELIKEETKHSCDCGGDCCAIHENMVPGKVFTGHGFAFRKEELEDESCGYTDEVGIEEPELEEPELEESDLGLTYKRGKTVKVTHKKSGKELVIIDKPNVKREYERIGYFAESVNEGFDKYRLGGLLDSKLKKRLERTIKIIGGKVDGVGDDYIKFRIGSMDLQRLPAVIKKLDRNKNVWIGDKRKKNIWDRRRNIDKLESVNEAGGVVTARIQQKPRGYWAVFNKKGESQFEGNKRFMIKILKKASTLSPNAIGSILDRARPGAKHLEFKAQFSRYYYNETVEEMLNPPNYLDNQAPTPVNSPEDENLVSRGKRTKKSGQPKFGTFRNESIKLDGVKKMIKLKDLITVNEKISKEEWAEYPKYARKLKPYMKRLLKIPVKVRVIKQANHNPWIEIRVARFGKDVIPNDFRKRALKVIGGGSRARDMDNIHYGNITAGSVSMHHSDWVKLLGNKVR